MCRAGYPVSRRAFHLGIVLFHISNRGCKNEIGVIFIIIHTYVGKTTGGYWQVLGGTGGYWWVLGRTGGYGWILDFYKCCVFDKACGPVELIRPANQVD